MNKSIFKQQKRGWTDERKKYISLKILNHILMTDLTETIVPTKPSLEFGKKVA